MNEVEEALLVINNYLSLKKEETIDANNMLSDIYSRIKEKNEVLEALSIRVETETKESTKKVLELQESIAPLESQKVALEKEVADLTEKKASLKVENVRLHTSNSQYIDYENRSRQILTAKEESLQAREKAVEQKEALKPRDYTILPSA